MATIQQNIKNGWEALEIKHTHLKANNQGDEYYPIQEEFKNMLKGFIYDHDLSLLTSKQLLKLCGWVNSHQPIAPHKFLSYCERFSE